MNILVIGAHPDDMEFGCGGTLLKLADKGCGMNLLVMTQGGAGGDEQTRVQEQLSAAKMLGANLMWGGFEDTNLPISREIIRIIETAIIRVQPDMVFCHYPQDTHQDHRQIGTAALSAARGVRSFLFYEGPSSMDFSPSVFTDIGNELPRKLELLKCHRSQVDKTNIPHLSILESAQSTAIYRGMQNRVKFAEGFMPHRLALDHIIGL